MFILGLFLFVLKSYLLGNYLKGFEFDWGYDIMKILFFLVGNFVKVFIFFFVIFWLYDIGRLWSIFILFMLGVSFFFVGVFERLMYLELFFVLVYYRVSSINGFSVWLEKRGEWYWVLILLNDYLKYVIFVFDRSLVFFVVVSCCFSFVFFCFFGECYFFYIMEMFKKKCFGYIRIDFVFFLCVVFLVGDWKWLFSIKGWKCMDLEIWIRDLKC